MSGSVCGGGAAQQMQLGGESGLLAFIFCTFWGNGADMPLVRFISTSDSNPKGKTNRSFR